MGSSCNFCLRGAPWLLPSCLLGDNPAAKELQHVHPCLCLLRLPAAHGRKSKRVAWLTVRPCLTHIPLGAPALALSQPPILYHTGAMPPNHYVLQKDTLDPLYSCHPTGLECPRLSLTSKRQPYQGWSISCVPGPQPREESFAPCPCIRIISMRLESGGLGGAPVGITSIALLFDLERDTQPKAQAPAVLNRAEIRQYVLSWTVTGTRTCAVELQRFRE